MSIPLALQAACGGTPAARRGIPAAPRGIPRRRAAAPGSAARRLVGGGALLLATALATFASLRCLGLLNLDTMTLLPAAASAGAAAMNLGALLASLRALRGA